MINQKHIAFIWPWDKAREVYPNWRDGLRAAIEIIGQKHDVDWFIGETPKMDNYDSIYFWDDSNSKFFGELDNFHAKKGLCLTTSPANCDNLRKLDAVFCESSIVYDQVRAQGIRAIRAFGTDSDFFTPDTSVKKDIKYFYPATFSPWKAQKDIAHFGNKLLCVGTIQPDGQEEYQVCEDYGVKTEVGYFPAEKIRDYYRRAVNVLIPAHHGSERTVLEAMSCGIVPEVMDLSNKTFSLIQEFRASGLEPREFILKNYSGQIYADQLLKL